MEENQVKIVLSKSITYDNQEITEIVLRKPKVRDLKGINFDKLNSLEENIKLVSRLSGVKPLALEDIELPDWLKIQEVVSGFFTESQKTTAN